MTNIIKFRPRQADEKVSYQEVARQIFINTLLEAKLSQNVAESIADALTNNTMQNIRTLNLSGEGAHRIESAIWWAAMNAFKLGTQSWQFGAP